MKTIVNDWTVLTHIYMVLYIEVKYYRAIGVLLISKFAYDVINSLMMTFSTKITYLWGALLMVLNEWMVFESEFSIRPPPQHSNDSRSGGREKQLKTNPWMYNWDLGIPTLASPWPESDLGVTSFFSASFFVIQIQYDMKDKQTEIHEIYSYFIRKS